MVDRSDDVGNRLLAALSPADLSLLQPHFRENHAEHGALMHESDSPIERVYFPRNGMISLLAVMKDGSGIEIATIGREGAVNLLAGLGSRRSASRAVMQVEGDVTAIAADKFRSVAEASPSMRDLIIRYNEVHMAIVQQTVACNGLHPAEQRFCRWLLQVRDRCESNEIPLTQEFLSQMLGVQRTSVTAIARMFQTANIIRYRRGKIEILDGAELERRSCECYEAVKGRVDETLI